jgi:hypothetical protein
VGVGVDGDEFVEIHFWGPLPFRSRKADAGDHLGAGLRDGRHQRLDVEPSSEDMLLMRWMVVTMA